MLYGNAFMCALLKISTRY